MGKKKAAKKPDEMTDEEFERWWNELIKGINFDNHEESYNFHMNYPSCLICGWAATHWIPSKADGWLMPACDKHYNDPKITERRWANARARRTKETDAISDLRCYKCGGRPVVVFGDDNYGLPECDKCRFAVWKSGGDND
jgi:hypothetical protein